MIIEGRVRIRTTPFDLPVFLFTIAVLLSAIFAVNRYDALIAFTPLLFVVLAYYAIVNLTKSRQSLLILIAAMVAGGTVSSVLAILSFFKVFILPFSYTKTQLFTPFGSLLDQAMYIALLLPVAGYMAYPLLGSSEVTATEELMPISHGKDRYDVKTISFAVAFVFLALGLSLTVYMLVAVQKPLILPFATGFQTAMAEISQDSSRVLQGFLMGNGFGTYLNVFTRFKSAAYNANPTLWSFTFFRSSSFILELLATTGILGVGAFAFLIYRVIREKHYFLPLILAILAAFLLPFSFTLIALFFVLLALFAVARSLHNPRAYGDLDFYFVAFKQGLFAAQPEGHQGTQTSGYARILPILFFAIMVAITGVLSYYSARFVISDFTFQQSLVAAAKNDGRTTYTKQVNAITMFPYRDAYHRIFSQTNLAIANSIAGQQPRGASPSADVQNNILQLIQQSINSGRQAVAIAPQTALNWNNLSSIYRSLIGFGQNADQFAIVTNQQAILLDPNNPQQYVNLGGIYYQLGQWDNAQREFTNAIQRKQDYANAYYNLGHAFESKGDLATALSAYELVKQLIANDADNSKKIGQEIDALKKKIGDQQANAAQQLNTPQSAENQTKPLEVNQPANQLPERNPKVTIPAAPSTTPIPSVSPTAGAKTTPTVTPKGR